ncbi:TonB-dependent receptor, partial [Sulfitobacter sp. CW3]|uniref:TonB-dependent receptor domain-containing protein n=1 Tax=Sulfitobacter sp. CW3 TaxID=2861965 RepID=UPI001C5DBBB1
NSAFTLPSGLLKAKYTFGENRDQSLTFSLTNTTSSERDVPYDTFATTTDMFGNVDRDITSRAATLTYNFNPEGNNLVDLDVQLSYADQQIDQTYIAGSSSLEGTPQEGQVLALTNADHRYETTKLSFKNTSLFDTGNVSHELRTGLELIRKKRLDANSATGGVDNRIAVYAVDDMRIGNAWTITPALRYETSEITGSTAPNDGVYDNDALMGGLSVRYAFDNGFAVFGSGAYTESLPILDDLNNATFMAMAEKSKTYELGASYDGVDMFRSGDSFAIKANLYKTELYDVTSYTTGVGRPAPNLASVDTEGLELEASYAMESGLYLDMNANITDGTQTAPDDTVSDWKNTAADSLRFTVGKKFGEELDVSWEVVANASTDVSGTETPGFGIHNLRATYIPQQGVLKDTQIRVGLENVFDRDYTPHLSTRSAPGRNLKLTLSRTF